MVIWRLEKAKYADTARLGEGARVVGARWTPPGHAAIYAAEHRSLAILEVLVHSPSPAERKIPRILFGITCHAGAEVEHVSPADLPADFGPASPYSITQPIGEAWLAARRSPILRVPSAVVAGEFNFVLNPAHPRFASTLTWDPARPVNLDPRLWV